MHYYQFNIGDYRADTAHLTLLEHGIYRQLLDWYYLDETPIPKETQVVYRRLSARTQDERDAVDSVLNDFFYLTDAYHHQRCDDEIRQYKHKAKVNRENGKRGGRPAKTQSVKSDNPNESESNPNYKSITNNHKPIKKRASPFIPPTVQDVSAYCAIRNNGVNPHEFINHYEANGWMRGKNKIKDWRACVRTWESKQGDNHGTNQQDTRSRAKRVSDKLDAIAAKSIAREGGIT